MKNKKDYFDSTDELDYSDIIQKKEKRKKNIKRKSEKTRNNVNLHKRQKRKDFDGWDLDGEY